jgi:phage N-6-adenine-methyltransferase
MAARLPGVTGNQHWRTPPWFIELLEREVGSFDIDGAATHKNAVAKMYFSDQDLAQDAHEANPSGRTIFVNPPYGRANGGLRKWIETFERWGKSNTVYALLPNSTDAAWFGRAAATSDEVRLIIPRLAFLDAEGVPVAGNMGGSVLVIWRPPGARPRSSHLWIWNIREVVNQNRA